MSKESKFAYGFWAAGVGVPYLVDKTLGPSLALITAIGFTAIGVIFVIAGHLHRDKGQIQQHRGAMATIGIFILVGALLGGLSGTILVLVRKQQAQHAARAAPEPPAQELGKQEAQVVAPAVSPTHKAPSSHSGAASDLSNAQVLDGARDLTRRLRQFQQESNQESPKLTDKFLRQMTIQGMTKEQAEDVQRAMVLELGKLHDKNEARFGPLRAESRNIINMLQNRVPPPQPIPSELVSIVLSTGPLAGPNPVGAVADYIDQLADLLPVTRTGVALIGEWLIGSEEQDYWKQELGRFPKTSAWIIANPQDPTAHNLGIEVDAIFHGIKWPSLVLPFTQITEWQLMTKYPRQGVVIIAPRQDAGVATLSHLFHREGIPVVVDENPTMTMTDGKQFTQNNQHFEGVIVAVGGK